LFTSSPALFFLFSCKLRSRLHARPCFRELEADSRPILDVEDDGRTVAVTNIKVITGRHLSPD
jgi:hypothetical protein